MPRTLQRRQEREFRFGECITKGCTRPARFGKTKLCWSCTYNHDGTPRTEPRKMLADSRLVLQTDTSWMDDAACRDDIDFTSKPWATQKTVCSSCPVKKPCLESALRWPVSEDLSVVAGGFTAAERRRIRKGELDASAVLA